MVATNYTNFHELDEFRKKKLVKIRVIRGKKNIYNLIKQINCNNIFLKFQFVFLNSIKTHT